MAAEARYQVVGEIPLDGNLALVIRDVGPWDQHPTVTNDAEAVVAELVASKRLTPGQPLYCYDSNGDLDRLLVREGVFAGFAPGPRDGPS